MNNNQEFRTGVIKPVEVYKEAWELIKDQYWLIFAVTLVGMLIGGAIPIVLFGPMMCGVYLVLFSKIDGRPVDFGELFKGFEYFLPSLIVSVIVMVPMFIMIFGIYVPIIGMSIAGQRMSQEEMMGFLAVTFGIEFVFIVLMVCLHTLLMFAFPLIVDRKLSAIPAIKLSAKAVWKNLGGIAGLFGVGFVVAIVGYLMLCIGLYLVIPLIMAAQVVAYRKIFPAARQANFEPPPPNAYRGL